MTGGHHGWRAAPLRVIMPGFTLERREDGPLLQLARLALIAAALSPVRWAAGDRSRADAAVARQRLRAAGGAPARNVLLRGLPR